MPFHLSRADVSGSFSINGCSFVAWLFGTFGPWFCFVFLLPLRATNCHSKYTTASPEWHRCCFGELSFPTSTEENLLTAWQTVPLILQTLRYKLELQ